MVTEGPESPTIPDIRSVVTPWADLYPCICPEPKWWFQVSPPVDTVTTVPQNTPSHVVDIFVGIWIEGVSRLSICGAPVVVTTTIQPMDGQSPIDASSD